MPYYINPPPSNPLSRLIAAIVAVFALIGSFMIGIAALLVIAGVALVAGLSLWARIAWIKRRMKKNGVDMGVGQQPSQPSHSSGNIIDAEYTVIPNEEDHSDK